MDKELDRIENLSMNRKHKASNPERSFEIDMVKRERERGRKMSQASPIGFLELCSITA